MDHWNIEGYEGPSEYRTEVLKGMKDQLVRSEVVMGYTVLDEFLTNIICDYYFRRKKGQVSSYRNLWKTKPFKVFVHHLMDVCRQSISDSWLGNLRECLAHLV